MREFAEEYEVSESSTVELEYFLKLKLFFSFKLHFGLVSRQCLFYFKINEEMDKLPLATLNA